jgi:uncharacterized protein
MMSTQEGDDQQANQWIRLLNLQPHPEGGYFAETYQSEDQVKLERFKQQDRSCSTSIYYLLKLPDASKSYFHRIQVDEIWHFYCGLPIIIHVLDENECSHVEHILCNDISRRPDARPQVLIPYGKWFAAELLLPTNAEEKQGNYALCGCTCSPAFDYADFECAQRPYLLEKFPHLNSLIMRLTPGE